MLNLYRRFSIAGKLWLLGAINVFTLVALMFLVLPQAKEEAIQREIAKARSIAETAAGSAKTYQDAVARGEMTQDEALTQWGQLVNNMLYSNGKEYVFATRYDGIRVAHGAKPETVGDNGLDPSNPDSARINAALIEIAKAGGGTYEYFNVPKGGTEPIKKISYALPVPGWDTFVGTGIYLARVDAQFASLQWLCIAFTVGASIIVLFVNWLTARDLSGPARDLASRVDSLANGEMVPESEYAGRADAIGSIARSVSRLRTMVMEREELQRAQAEAEAKMKAERAAAVRRTADDLDAKVANVVDSMRGDVGKMTAQAESLRALAKEMTDDASDILSACQDGNASVQTVAAAAEELSASSSEIGEQVDAAAGRARSAVTEAEKAAETLRVLAKTSSDISEATKLINDIAEKTNLLALNATIEAARAGESGKGFTVVAQEVKALAEQTAKATSEIERHIEAMHSAATASVSTIDSIVAVIGEVSANTTAMAAALEEQGVAIREVTESIAQAARSTDAVSTNMGRVRTRAETTNDAAEVVLKTTTGIDTGSSGLKSTISEFIRGLRASSEADVRASA
ncbi:methyl-accepting chemotaxis protein [Acuticoccus sediminis]|uniref:methyl-accepting chemotaxis protein n=1 Tax=Acuticoccus sediminis TaxID=2184697 RepID=UPI001CFDCC4A|nr:methyl-accepting chemotaxis protein [Acuticoccus sediminis]